MTQDKPSYLAAMLTSTPNMVALGVTLGVTGIVALAGGLALGAIPLVLFAGGEAIASMIAPNLSTFRNKVDREWRRAKRSKARQNALTEICSRVGVELDDDERSLVPTSSRTSPQDKRAASDYNDMISRILSLSKVADDNRTSLGDSEIERLHEAALDYLSMWLARTIISQRENSVDLADIRGRIATHTRDIEVAKREQNTVRVRTLERARADLTGILQRHTNLDSKSAAIEAAMLAMPDKINEIHQMILAAPYSSMMDSRLEDSLSRLRLAEEVEQEIHSELYDTLPSDPLDNLIREPVTEKPKAKLAAAKQTTTLSR